jgi:intracellular sulfur oxidation DsrE/DsrF family protein
MRNLRIAIMLLAGIAAPVLAAPIPVPNPVITGYGRAAVIADPFQKPDPKLRYRVVFEVKSAADKPEEVNNGLQKVARFVNLLGSFGIRPRPGDLVVTIYGKASSVTLTAAGHAAHENGAANPNIELIQKLTDAGVSIRLCGQSMVGHGYGPAEINPNVKVDTAAITTMATLQLQGYALLPD